LPWPSSVAESHIGEGGLTSRGNIPFILAKRLQQSACILDALLQAAREASQDRRYRAEPDPHLIENGKPRLKVLSAIAAPFRPRPALIGAPNGGQMRRRFERPEVGQSEIG
jgi:hypothetical protein